MSRNALAVLVLAGVVAVTLFAAGCAPKEPPKPEPNVIVNKFKGFSITYPGDWKTWEGGRGTDVEGYPPDQTDPNVLRDMLFVYVEDLPGALSLDEYAQVKSAHGTKVLPEYKEEETTSAELSGVPAKRVVYSAVMADTRVTSLAYFLVSGKRGYMIIGSADESRFAERKGEFEKIAATLKLNP